MRFLILSWNKGERKEGREKKEGRMEGRGKESWIIRITAEHLKYPWSWEHSGNKKDTSPAFVGLTAHWGRQVLGTVIKCLRRDIMFGELQSRGKCFPRGLTRSRYSIKLHPSPLYHSILDHPRLHHRAQAGLPPPILVPFFLILCCPMPKPGFLLSPTGAQCPLLSPPLHQA